MQTDDALLLIRRAWIKAWVLRVGFAFIGAFTVLATFLTWLAPETSHQSRAQTVADFLMVFTGFVLVAFAIVIVVDRWRWRQVLAWFHDHSETKGRDIMVRLAWYHAVESLAVWTAGSFVFALADASIGNSPGRSALLFGGAFIGGMSLSVATYLLCDVVLRPAVALALTSQAPDPGSTPGVRSRLFAVWLASAGIPLAGVGLALVWHRVFDVEMGGPIVAILVAGIIAGIILNTGASRSVAEPVERVRQALARVEGGDLSAGVDLVVDDPSELGSLARGFNQMVDSLRQRALIEDLFGRHVGADVARQALDHGVDLSGEQRDATVLMVDLVGSTALSEREPAAHTLRVINAMFDAVEQAVEAEDGWITQFQGDAALVVFGVPNHRHDHARRALRAAVELRAELNRLRRTLPDLDVGIGIASGVVVAGHIGARRRISYNVLGDPANVAARLCDLAKNVAGRTLADASTVHAAGAAGTDRWHFHEVVSLRGRTQPTTCFGLLAPSEAPPVDVGPAPPSLDHRRGGDVGGDVQRGVGKVPVHQSGE